MTDPIGTVAMSASRDNIVELRQRPRWDHALVPAGDYEARVIGNDVRTYFRKAPKLAVWFMLTTPGVMETVVPAFYAIPGPKPEKPRRNGYYQAVGRASRLARDLAAMLDGRVNCLHGPFPRELIEPYLYRVRVETVTHDRDQQPLPHGARYSRVDRVLGRVQ